MGVDHIGVGALQQQIEALQRNARRRGTLQNASIGRAGIRVYDGGWIRIEDGGLSVTGTAYVTGLLEVSGQLTGSGDLSWSGPWDLSGLGTVTGNVVWSGDVEQTGRHVVKAGGAIIVEGDSPITLEQSGGIAHMLMGTSEIRGGDGGLGLYSGAGPAITLTSLGIRMAPLNTIKSADANGAVPGTLWVDLMGIVYRVIAD